jgi:spore maturation protein CgeB
MKIVIFGLTISSSWGNGHATIWRGLCKALGKKGHKIIFFEKDVPYYASERDAVNIPGTEVILYNEWEEFIPSIRKHLKSADAAIVTSYCPDGIKASEEVFNSQVLKIFYDLDTPVTISNIEKGNPISYIHPDGLRNFNLVFSYTGGKVLNTLTEKLGAVNVFPLYGCADPETHFPVAPQDHFGSLLSYLGTYSEDRQDKLNSLFLQAAIALPDKRFTLGGSMYPIELQWPDNIYRIEHVAPSEHPAFYCSSDFTLNITRGTMAENGYCPSGRLFEAAACGIPVISDYFEGLDQFFMPGKEIIIVSDTTEVIEALSLSEKERKIISDSARERILSEHTCYKRADEFEKAIDSVYSSRMDVCGE